MDINRRKELLAEYKNRRPEMGVYSYRCKTTGESFLGISTDTKASFNKDNFELLMGTHRNKRLQELWNQYGKTEFEISVVKVLKYKEMADDHSKKLEKLLEQCFEDDENATKI